MTIYTVDWAYGKDDKKTYYVSPYSLKGTLLTHFGIDLRNLTFPSGKTIWSISYYPWHVRFTSFFDWVMRSRLSKNSAQKLADKMNKKELVSGEKQS